MKTILIVIGAIGAAFGFVWALQGLKILPPLLPTLSHNAMVTLGNGALLIAFSAALIVWANRSPRQPRA
ncbi:MAG TPA: hypothetical protein VN805_14970 [Caulobacteraceae bacterium]|nr:hypothetical protein [Caulobacteraceae bacterium]